MLANNFDRLYKNINLNSIFMRRALRTAFAVFVSVLVYRYFALLQGFWVPLTVVIVMQATTAATLRKGLQRFLGTMVGILLGSILLLKIHNVYIIDTLLIVFLFLAYYLKAFNLINYGIFVIPISITVVFLVSTFVPVEAQALIVARLYDTIIGAIIGVVVTLVVFPNSLKKEVSKGIQHFMVGQYYYFNAIVACLLQTDSTEVNAQQEAITKRDQFEKDLSLNRRLFEDWKYELWIKFIPGGSAQLKFASKERHENFLQLSEKIGQFLFSLHYLAKKNDRQLIGTEWQIPLQALIQSVPLTTKESVISFQEQATFLRECIYNLKFIYGNSTSADKSFINALLVNLEGYQHCLQELEK